MGLIKRASKDTIGESSVSIMSGSFGANISAIALDSQGRMLNVALTSGSNHEQWSNFNITTTASTHVWSEKAYSVIIQNTGPGVVHIGFDESASTATYPISPKYTGGGDIQHTYLSLMASSVSSTVFCMATW